MGKILTESFAQLRIEPLNNQFKEILAVMRHMILKIYCNDSIEQCSLQAPVLSGRTVNWSATCSSETLQYIYYIYENHLHRHRQCPSRSFQLLRLSAQDDSKHRSTCGQGHSFHSFLRKRHPLSAFPHRFFWRPIWNKQRSRQSWRSPGGCACGRPWPEF